MAELKTKPSNKDVMVLINAIESEKKRNDALLFFDLFKSTTKLEPIIWGENIIGFGKYSYKYPSGRTGEWFKVGFSPKKQNITVYLSQLAYELDAEKTASLGKFKLGKSCLYFNSFKDVNADALKQLIELALKR
ncbi:MAG: DUF1801 domain-containing protein [Bacteroidales bacterium]|nr:DUF1801 domain-containing protein [Bacteroidales bacterium]